MPRRFVGSEIDGAAVQANLSTNSGWHQRFSCKRLCTALFAQIPLRMGDKPGGYVEEQGYRGALPMVSDGSEFHIALASSCVEHCSRTTQVALRCSAAHNATQEINSAV